MQCPRLVQFTSKTSMNIEESDSDDEEDYGIQRNSFGAPMYGPKLAKYLNCFLGSLLVPLQHMEWKPDYKGNFCKKEEGDGQWHAEIRLTDPYKNSVGTHNDEADSSSSRPKRARITKSMEEALMGHVLHEILLWGNCNMTLKNRYNTNLTGNLSKQIYSPFIIDWNVLNTLGCGNAIKDMLEVRVKEIGSDEVMFTSEAWKRDEEKGSWNTERKFDLLWTVCDEDCEKTWYIEDEATCTKDLGILKR
ncbi:hypothetical protein Tco_0006134 [Tanacetum coccineum]